MKQELTIERLEDEITEDDLAALCEAADAAILDGGGFGWVTSPGRQVMQRYFKGVLLVPERVLFIARLNGVVVGSAQMARPARNNEAQSFTAYLVHTFVAPYARRLGLGRMLVRAVEEHAKGLGCHVLNLDVRESQDGAIGLFESAGYTRWGAHPAYARVAGKIVTGFYYYKSLKRPRPDKPEAEGNSKAP